MPGYENRLSADAAGDELYLPTFDGAHAFLYNVRKIHTGFSGPATGEHYVRFVGDVKATLDRLLAES